MPKVYIDAKYDRRTDKYFTEVIPSEGSSVPFFRSSPSFDDRYAAERGGLRYLEMLGVAKFCPDQVAQAQGGFA